MRPEISNELLLQVIQAWDPAEVDQWWVDDENELRWGENQWYIRWPDGQVYCYNEGSSYCKASKLVEFLLKDRPDLGDPEDSSWPYVECTNACNGFWLSDPWESETTSNHMVQRIKSYEYLKAWKEKQPILIDPSDVTLSIDGQAIEGMEMHDDVLEVPTTYEKLCPHCNGSKEVTGWHGKESCQQCG